MCDLGLPCGKLDCPFTPNLGRPLKPTAVPAARRPTEISRKQELVKWKLRLKARVSFLRKD